MKKPYIRPIAAVKKLDITVPYICTSNDFADTKRQSFDDYDSVDEE